MQKPLSEILRPSTLSEFTGQDHIAGENGIVTKLLTNSQTSSVFPSLILWGPPGTGKTTLARIIAKELELAFYELSAVNASSNEIKKIIEVQKGSKPLLFIDEIHRFNKAQQDRLLPHVERGELLFIGATTENPSFEVINALLSRVRVLVLNPLDEQALNNILTRALNKLELKIDKEAKRILIDSSSGDARFLINTLEVAKLLNPKITSLSKENVLESFDKSISFDKKGEEHYNTISAYIKSMRAGDIDAALYYLAVMTEAGQDPKFIARRMVIFASEDIGMAQPTALVVANEVFRACETIGYPECAINLAHGTVYLAKAKKDRSAYDAYFKALGDVKRFGNLPVPLSLRNAPTKLMKSQGYAKGYEMYPDKDKNLLPKKLKGKKYYED